MPWQILSLKKNQPEEFEEWLQLVQLALPSIQQIQAIVREDDRHAYLKVHYQNGIALPWVGEKEVSQRVKVDPIFIPYFLQ